MPVVQDFIGSEAGGGGLFDVFRCFWKVEDRVQSYPSYRGGGTIIGTALQFVFLPVKKVQVVEC